MATKVTIQIAAVDANNKKITDKIAYVNPEATDEKLVEFAIMLEQMTNNTYTGTTKITEETIG